MTHTYLRMKEDQYDVGMWLSRADGLMTFNPLFSVPNIRQAFIAVNALNGGQRISPEALHIEEKE